MKWLLLLFGIAAELCGSTFMKMSEGFTKLYPSIITFVLWAAGLTIFIFALNNFDLSFAYAIWAGVGILGVSLIGIFFFKEPYNMIKIVFIIIIVIGVIGLNINEIINK
jgi:small multidrug resistance pump